MVEFPDHPYSSNNSLARIERKAYSMKWTIIGLLIGLSFWNALVFFDIERWRLMVDSIHRLEMYEIDELFIFLPTTSLGIFADLFLHGRRSRRARKLTEQKLHVVHTTVATLDDLLGNNLLNLKCLLSHSHKQRRMENENHKRIVELVQHSLNCLQQLRNLSSFHEKETASGAKVIDLEKAGEPTIWCVLVVLVPMRSDRGSVRSHRD